MKTLEAQIHNNKINQNVDDTLKKNGLSFTINNDGTRYVITDDSKLIDFWPSSGRWICRTTKTNGHILQSLIKHLRSNGNEQN
jgi:hypothetical protein